MQRNIEYQHLFSQAKYYPMRESWDVIIQIGTLHTLSVLIFAGIHFCKLKKSYFTSTYFLRMASFWKCEVYKFQLHRKQNKKKTLESRDMRLIFLSRSMERQAGRNGKTVVTDLFLKKAELTTNIIWIYEFFAYLACIYFRKCRLEESLACI